MTEGAKVGRGWGLVVGLSLLAAALSVVHPALLIFLPLSLLLLALPPRRPPLLVLGLALGAVAFAGYGAADALWYVERGWALLLGGWFVAMVVLLPRSAFFSRSLAALGATAVTGALLLLARRGGWAHVDWAVSRRIRAAATDAAAVFGPTLDPSWSGAFMEGVQRAAELQALLYPALLGLGSLAALAVAWWAFRRLAALDATPLGRLREFRFRDELVWLLVLGIGLVLLPVGGEAQRAGSNFVAFMAALYALRGGAVMLALAGRPSVFGALFAGLLLVLLPPVVIGGALLIGLTDTWVDLRSRARAKA